MMKRAMISIILSTVLTAPAAAQDNPQQTPANAALFLSKLVAANAMTVAFYSDNRNVWPTSEPGWNRVDVGDESHNYGDYLVTAFAMTEECKSSVRFTVPGKWEGYTAPYQPYSDNDGNGSGMTIVWTKVSFVSRVGNGLVLPQAFPGAEKFKIRLSFQDPDLAARAALALEVIRSKCDPTAGTGF